MMWLPRSASSFSPAPTSTSASPSAVLLLVPSRGRPDKLDRLYRACLDTCTSEWHIRVGLDVDDPQFKEYMLTMGKFPEVMLRGGYTVDDRTGLGGWTNRLAWKELAHPNCPEYLVSIGDDMVPVTRGWDQHLVDAMPEGGGFTYPEDGRRNDIPECVMTTAGIVRALGYLAEPSLRHWYLDNVWRDLGALTDSLRYVPWAVVEHRHPNVKGGDKPDGTYHEAAESYDSDLAAYQRWRFKRMGADAAIVAGVRAQARDPERHAGSPG